MSRYFSLFNTEAQYEAAKDTLDFPNVSLIDTTGDLHYVKYTGQNVANAPFGSILMAEVATNKIFYILDSEYNLTDYPFADYKPIAVCIFDKDSNSNNQTVFLSVQFGNNTTLGHGTKNDVTMSWGFYDVNLTTDVPEIASQTASSVVINKKIKNIIPMSDYVGVSSISNNLSSSSAFCTCFRYKTPGTSEGEWYLPSYYDLTKFKDNKDTIDNVFSHLITLLSSYNYVAIITKTTYFWTSTSENNSNKNSYCWSAGSLNTRSRSSSGNTRVRPVFIAGIEEL